MTRSAHPAARDALSRGQRNALVAVIVGLHALVGWALLQVSAVRQAVFEAAPIFVDIIAPEVTKPEPPPPQPPPPQARVVPKRPPPIVASKAVPTPATSFVVEAPPEDPPPVVAVAEPAPPTAPVAAPEPAPPAPKVIPSSSVQYLVAPPLEYPRASRRMRESGKVMVRVYIDADGLPRNVQIDKSSGHVRLDDAAIAAVNKARFKPYTENGRPTPGWAYIPLSFDLER